MTTMPIDSAKPGLRQAPTPRQSAKQKLRARETVLGINPEFASSGLVEFCAQLGADLIFIDCEHGGPNIETVSDMVRAAHAAGAAAVLRPWSKDPGLLRRYIDAGVDGLIVPDVRSCEEVRGVVQLIEECAPADADNILLIALIESYVAYEGLSDILATGLIDAVLVGSGDLALSMGLPRRGDHQRVREITFDIVAQARKAGVSAGAPLNRYGVKPTFLAGGNLVMFFARDLLREGFEGGCSLLMQDQSIAVGG